MEAESSMTIPKMTPVHGSSNVQSIGYDETTQTLYVKQSFGFYRIEDVSRDLVNLLEAAESKGSFIQKTIKPGRTVTRVDEAAESLGESGAA
jgi:hypothetical protein